MSNSRLIGSILLPNLKLEHEQRTKGVLRLTLRTQRRPMACPSCASKCTIVYDQRQVTVRDIKLMDQLGVVLQIWKKRYWCPKCKKPKTEPVDGIFPRRRTTERFRRSIMYACKNFESIKRVQEKYKVSSDFAYQCFYQQLELETRKRKNPWPTSIGIDEHSFKRNKRLRITEFATVIVNHNAKRIEEVIEGKTGAALEEGLNYIPGRENVKNVTIDMCDPFKKFAKDFFPNATLIADKFHVLRLITPAINQCRKEITGDRRTLRIRKDLLTNRRNLSYDRKLSLDRFIENFPDLYELYWWKERLHGFYRIKGLKRAKKALGRMLDDMAHSKLKAIKTLRKTLLKWSREILAYFKTRLTNARAEGFNNTAKTIKKQAYGYKSFKNYRLRLMNVGF